MTTFTMKEAGELVWTAGLTGASYGWTPWVMAMLVVGLSACTSTRDVVPDFQTV